jgi:glucose-1-phosphate thymidylyltransferase
MEVKGVLVADELCARPDPGSLNCAGALEHVANKPIAHHVLDDFASAGIEEVVVVSSARSAAAIRVCLTNPADSCDARRSQLRIRFVDQPAPLELHSALALAAPLVGGAACVVHLATGLLEQPLEPLIRRVGGASPDLIATVHQTSNREWHLNLPTQEMLHLAELHPERANLSMAGVCVFGPDAIGLASRTAWQPNGGDEVDLTGVAAQINAEGGTFQVLPVNSWRRYAGNPLDLLELNRIALDRMHHDMQRPSGSGNLIEGRVWIHESASVRTSVIVGPTVVGPNAQIADAYIGPFTSIGVGARVEGAEIERSIIAAGASIMHVRSRLVSSVVGRDARVFRDFSLPRAYRLLVGDGTEIALC